MYFGLTIEKLLLIALLVALVIGPERLPAYAESAKKWIRKGRDLVRHFADRARGELGSDFDDVDWRSLDPRQYDPRRIIRAALLEEDAQTTQPASDRRSEPIGRIRPALPASMMPKNSRPSSLSEFNDTLHDQRGTSGLAGAPADPVGSQTSTGSAG
ncbi:Sec-independent protein translocase TatB [Microbacterium trichothecenolyticum]